jgi:hypothetical protein
MEQVETREAQVQRGKNNPLRNFGRQLGTLGNLYFLAV